MQALIYYLSLPFLYLISALPFPLLYLMSDLVYFLLYYILGYRKKIVTDNLRRSFPEKTEAEIILIRKRFYHYLCDLFLETFKTLTISRKAMLKHCYFDQKTEEILDRYLSENKSTILVLGHYGNWEWAGNTFSLMFRQPLYVIYHPLRNKNFDRLIYRMRTRFGTRLIPMKETFRQMLGNRAEVNATAFIADQTPQPDNAFWIRFLNQDTPFFKGTAIISKKLNIPVVYVSVKRVKRGYYSVSIEEFIKDPAELSEMEITERYAERLEKDIRDQPEIWLWSHRRWKHKRPSD